MPPAIYYPPSDFTDQQYESGIDPAKEILEKLNADAPITYNDTTFTIGNTPASASNSGYVTVGTQTMSGDKTFNGSSLGIKHASATGPAYIQTNASGDAILRTDVTDGTASVYGYDGYADVIGTKGAIVESTTGNVEIKSLNGVTEIRGGAVEKLTVGSTNITAEGSGIFIKNNTYGGSPCSLSQDSAGNFFISGETDKNLNIYVPGSTSGTLNIGTTTKFVNQNANTTFSGGTNPPICSIAPTSGSHLVNKTYADGLGGGDVYGPASSTDTSLAIFDGTTGKLLKDGGVTVTTPTADRLQLTRGTTVFDIYNNLTVNGPTILNQNVTTSSTPQFNGITCPSGTNTTLGWTFINTDGGNFQCKGNGDFSFGNDFNSTTMSLCSTGPKTIYIGSAAATKVDIDAINVYIRKLDTKGDLLVQTSGASVDKFAAGTNGYVLMPDSTQGSGLRWSATSSVSYAEMYMQDNTTATSGISTGVPMKMAGTTTAGSLSGFTHPTSNRLLYGGGVPKLFHLSASGSWLYDDATSQELAAVMFYMYDDSGSSGAVIAKSKLTTKLDNDGDCPSSFSLDCMITLDTDDYIEVWVERIGGNDDEIIVRGINVNITGV